MSAKSRRVGVFGGAFDPPHQAHLALLQVAVAQLELDEIRVFPTGQAWHKSRPLSPAPHRLAMVERAFSSEPKFVLDSREILRPGPSYTVDTLREIQAELPEAELFLVIGADQARSLANWHEGGLLTQLAIICVAEREELTGDTLPFCPPEELQSRFRQLKMPVLSISATEIRLRRAAHQGIVPLVTESVAQYIDHHHLYQTT